MSKLSEEAKELASPDINQNNLSSKQKCQQQSAKKRSKKARKKEKYSIVHAFLSATVASVDPVILHHLSTLIANRQKLSSALLEIRNQFNEEVRNARSAKFAASTTAVAGSVLSVVGFGLSFFTFGASAVVGYVGTGIAGASSSASAGCAITKYICKNRHLKEIAEFMREDEELCHSFNEFLSKLTDYLGLPEDYMLRYTEACCIRPLKDQRAAPDEEPSEKGSKRKTMGKSLRHYARKMGKAMGEETRKEGRKESTVGGIEKTTSGVADTASIVSDLTQGAGQVTDHCLTVAKGSADALTTTAKASETVASYALAASKPVQYLDIAGGVVSTIFLPLQIYRLVKDGIELRRNEPDKLSQKLDEMRTKVIKSLGAPQLLYQRLTIENV